MRRVGAYGVTVLLLLFALASVSDASRKAGTAPTRTVCPGRHLRILHRNRQAVVYTATVTIPFIGGGHFEEIVVRGCTRAVGRPYDLGSLPGRCSESPGCDGVEREALAGPIVAYVKYVGGGVGGESEKPKTPPAPSNFVTVRNLSDGKVLHRLPTGAGAQPESAVVEVGDATALVVKPDGSAAWISESDQRSDGAFVFYEVHAVEGPEGRVLAAGTNIRPSSLRLTGSTLRWRQGERSVAAVLR